MSNQNEIVIYDNLKHYSTCSVVDQSKERQNLTLKQTHVIYCVKFLDGVAVVILTSKDLASGYLVLGRMLVIS